MTLRLLVFFLLLGSAVLPCAAQQKLSLVGRGCAEAEPCERRLYQLIRSSSYPRIKKLHYWLFDGRDSAVLVRLTGHGERQSFPGQIHYPYVGTLRIDLRNRRIEDVTAAYLEDGAAPRYLRCDTAIFDRIDAACLLPAEPR